MRYLVGILSSVMRTRRQRRNLRMLGWLACAFLAQLAVFSGIFHWLMAREGQRHSWVTSVYWTIVTMSTLGFGDITFRSDAGRAFTIVVLLSGTIFLLLLLPFTFVQFFLTPWMEAQEAALMPRSNRERNVTTLHRAGADFVMSYATTGATAIYNLLKRVDILLVAEGLHVFRLDTPASLIGKCLAESDLRRSTGCTVIAIGTADHFDCNPDALRALEPGSELVVVGDVEAESRFIERYGRGPSAPS